MVVTIPKKLSKGKEDLVVIPRREYEKLLWREPKIVKGVPMTASEKRALARARKAKKEGKLLTLDEFLRKMGRKG